MVDNKPILKLLNKHKPADKSEEEPLKTIINFVSSHDDCFENDFKLGHITGSAFVVDENLEHTLLTHHSVIDKWFQFGGHSDGHNIVSETAMREAQEESGLKNLKFHPDIEGIFDVDVHLIPEKGNMPAHNHHDIRFLIVADKNEAFIISDESKDLKWIKLEDVENYNSQPAMVRMANKAIALRRKK